MAPLNLPWTIALDGLRVDKSARHRSAGARLDGNDCASPTAHPMGQSPPNVQGCPLPSHAASPQPWPGYRLAKVSWPTLWRAVKAGLA
jgi:hypothetical protein